MAKTVNNAEIWTATYAAYQNVNFSSFDFEVVKASLIDYLKIYHAESFNDFIESSEFIALLELFAYLSELCAYRIDLNSHENFLSTAQRKQSVLRLAKLISYNTTRNLPARGLVKLTSVSTSETVLDSDGVNLAYRNIIWNDSNNPKWREQFFIVIQKILEQEFGSVSPSDRVQVDDTLFELYQLKTFETGLVNGVYSYAISLSGSSYSMELVPSSLDEFGPYEKRPDLSAPFSIVYASDGLGDSSNGTGFFVLTKQGTLSRYLTDYDGVTPNQTTELDKENINDTDVWINNIDADTGEILDDGSVENGRSGEWQQVDIANAQNIIFNTNENRNKYEIETLEDDKIRIIFGDGEFATIPSGRFEIWSRTSSNENVVVPQSAINNNSASFSYYDIDNNIQTFGWTFSLVSALQNASISEDIERIRRNAPSVYYSQDRMVNGKDYNTFMLKDPSILKLRAVNRTFAGDSKYITWHDPKEYYENVKLFGDDMALYLDSSEVVFDIFNKPIDDVLDDEITDLLERMDIFLAISLLPQNNPQRRFTTSERTELLNILNTMVVGDTAYLYHSPYIIGPQTLWWSATIPVVPPSPRPNTAIFTIEQLATNVWRINFISYKMIVESKDTKFWNVNNGETVITYDSLLSTSDEIYILKANENRDKNALLSENMIFDILGHIQVESGLPDAGTPDIHKLSVLPIDQNGDNIPDNVDLSNLINPHVITSSTGLLILPIYYINGYNDVSVIGDGSEVWNETGVLNDVVNTINVTSLGTNVSLTFIVNDYVYFYREDYNTDTFSSIEDTLENIESFVQDADKLNYKREHGKNPFNFLWTHKANTYHLIDPAASNLIDMFLITRGYYTSVKNWLDGVTNLEPIPPTAYQLRNDYSKLLDNKMLSDTVILHPGKFKILFGEHAEPELKASFKVVRSSSKRLTDNQIKTSIVTTIRNFFDISKWEFGETFFYTELATAIHNSLGGDIDTVVLVPTNSNNSFGDLFQVSCGEDEVFIPSISVNDIQIVESLNPTVIRKSV